MAALFSTPTALPSTKTPTEEIDQPDRAIA